MVLPLLLVLYELHPSSTYPYLDTYPILVTLPILVGTGSWMTMVPVDTYPGTSTPLHSWYLLGPIPYPMLPVPIYRTSTVQGE